VGELRQATRDQPVAAKDVVRRNMSLLGTIVTSPFAGPFKGVLWVVKTLAEHAEQELYNEDNIRKDLLGLEQQYELGKITLVEFESAENELLQRLNQARRMKEGC
jgi:hypothetical protein